MRQKIMKQVEVVAQCSVFIIAQLKHSAKHLISMINILFQIVSSERVVKA